MSQNAAQAAAAPTTTPLSDGTDVVSLLTSIHLIWIAILAAVVIAGIVYGARVKRRRTIVERRMREHAEEAGVEVAPPTAAKPAPPPAATAPVDDAAANGSVTQLKGLGPKVAARLADLGITTVGQLAALDDDGARALDERMGPFQGRLERDRWIEQARFLAAGDVKGFEAVFGRL